MPVNQNKRDAVMGIANASSPSVKRIDSVQLQRNLVITLGFAATILIAGFTLKTGNILLMTGFLALPFVLMLMNRPDLAFLIGVIADAADIAIGGINYLTLGVLAQVLVIGSVILAKTLQGGIKQVVHFAEDRPLKYFVAVILILMVFRGSGLRVLGSETWGGMVYIRIILSILFYWAIRGVQITRKQFKWLITCTVVAGIIGSLVQRAGFVTGTASTSSLQESIGQSRLTWVTPFVYSLFPLILAVRWRPKLIGLSVWLSMLGILGLTGFRSRFVMLIIVTFIYGFLRSGNRLKYFFSVVALGLVLWMGVLVTSPFYPRGLQRAVSFIPGVSVDAKVKADAEGSVEWRLEIWKYCLSESKPYLLLGRGSAFNIWETVDELSSSDIHEFTPWFAFQTRSYHSGPLSLLIDYGIPGLLAGLWLAVAIFVRLCKVSVRLNRINSLEARYAQALIAWLLWDLIAFFVVFGAMPKFGMLIVNAAVVTVLSYSVFKINETSDIKALDSQNQIKESNEVCV